jgi:hypothetical protein
VSLFGILLRVYSYLFHLFLTLFLLALSLVSLLNGQELQLKMLPWTGMALTYWVLGLSLAGLVSLILAMRGVARPLFTIWALAVAAFAIRGFFLSSYYFRAPEEFNAAVWFTVAAVLAVFGAWSQWRRKPPARRKDRML